MGGGKRELIYTVSPQKPEPRRFYPGFYATVY